MLDFHYNVVTLQCKTLSHCRENLDLRFKEIGGVHME